MALVCPRQTKVGGTIQLLLFKPELLTNFVVELFDLRVLDYLFLKLYIHVYYIHA